MGSKKRWQPPFPDPSKQRRADGRAERVTSALKVATRKYRRCLVRSCGRPVTESLIESEVLLCESHAAEVLGRLGAFLPVDQVDEPEPEPSPQSSAGWVYYFESNGLIKIGWTSDLARRMRQHGPGIVLLAIEPGSRRLEHARHSLFNEFLAEGREWFTDSPEIRAHIDRVVVEHGAAPEIEIRRKAVQQQFPGTMRARRRTDRRREHDGSAAMKRPAT